MVAGRAVKYRVALERERLFPRATADRERELRDVRRDLNERIDKIAADQKYANEVLKGGLRGPRAAACALARPARCCPYSLRSGAL
jgi:hypothetical protein